MRILDGLKALAKLPLMLLALLAGCNRHPGTAYEVHPVPHTDRTSLRHLRFDVTADPRGTLHLAWQGEREALHYQRSSDHGLTWSAPQVLAPPADGFSYPPEGLWLFSHEEHLALLWTNRKQDPGLFLRRSLDGGRHWSEADEEPVLAGPAGVPPRHYVLAQAGATLYAAYAGEGGIQVHRSDDLGKWWSVPVEIAAPQRPERGFGGTGTALAMHRGVLYVLWTEGESRMQDRLARHYYYLYLASSQDGGTNWSAPVEIIPDLEPFGRGYTGRALLHRPTLRASDVGLHVSFSAGGKLLYMRLAHDGQVLVPPRSVVGWGSGTAYKDVLVDEEETLRMAWLDKRYTVWTVSWPLLFNSGFGVNSDLMVNTIREGKPGRAQVVTPFLSGIATPPQLCRVPSGEVFMFWGGEKKVRKTRRQYGHPTEIFFARVF